jgi:hypothetical protein
MHLIFRYFSDLSSHIENLNVQLKNERDKYFAKIFVIKSLPNVFQSPLQQTGLVGCDSHERA